MPQSAGASWMASAGARIAKPLRGGGGAPTAAGDQINGGPSIPIINSLAGGDGGKRSSWFFNKS
jgi:kinesin family member 5